MEEVDGEQASLVEDAEEEEGVGELVVEAKEGVCDGCLVAVTADEERGVHLAPMAANVQDHQAQEQHRLLAVQMRQNRQQRRRGTPAVARQQLRVSSSARARERVRKNWCPTDDAVAYDTGGVWV